MTHNKKLNFKIGLLAILTLLVFGIGCVLAYTTNAQKVYADYDDLSGDTIVNFNQWVSDTYIQTYDYSAGYTAVDGTDFASVSGHIYYISCYSTVACQLQFHTGSSRQAKSIAVGQNDSLITCDSDDYTIIYVWVPTGYSTTITNFKVIDVSQMYGSGNEPSLSQCKEIFTSDYYAYNTGTSMALNGVDSYNLGYNDAMGAYTITLNNYDVIASLYSYDTSYFGITGTNNQAIAFTGIVGFDLGFTVNPGNVLVFNLSSFLLATDADIEVGYISNNTFVPIFSDVWDYIYEVDYFTGGATFTISMPVSTSSLFFRSVSSSAESYSCLLNYYTIETRIYNYQQAIKASYDTGYDKGYLAGIAKGETIGYSEGLAAAENATFQSLFAAIIDAPVNVIASALDFDLLGINLKTFFFSLFTVALVITIVRLFI